MKAHSNSFKEQIKEMGRELDSIITYGDTVLGNEQLNAVTPSFQSAILKSTMKQLDIDSNIAIPIGTVLNYKFGVKVNGEYEYIDFGNFIVKEVEKQEDTLSYKITCYDKMLLTMKDYVKIPITYPITIRDYIDSLCTFLGLKFANANDVFANYDKEIANELYLDINDKSLGYTFRDIFDELAQVTASTICINANDEVEIRYINNTGDTIDEEYLKDINVNFGEKYGPINTIVLSRASESDKIYKSFPENLPDEEKKSIEIADNQIMNFNDRSDYLPDILEKLNGLEYYTNDFTSTGITYYDICDKYNVKIGNNTYPCIMFNDEILITQGLQENIYTEIPEKAVTEYQYASSSDKASKNAYIIAKKNEAKIEQVVESVGDENGNVTSASIVLAINNDKSEVKIEGDKITLGNYYIQDGNLVTEIYAPYNYTETDIQNVIDYMFGLKDLTDEEKEKYDFDKNGKIDLTDLLFIQKSVLYGVTPTSPIKIGIMSGPNIFSSAYVITNGFGEELTKVNADGFFYKKQNVFEKTFAQIVSNGMQTFANGTREIVSNWFENTEENIINLQKGFFYDSFHNGIKIPAGTAKYVKISGNICGSGNVLANFLIQDENGLNLPNFNSQRAGLLMQPSGNSFFQTSLPNIVVKLDDTKDWYIKLAIQGYNGEFVLNNGFSDTSTYYLVEKIN